MQQTGFSRHLLMDNGKACAQVHPDCILRGPDSKRHYSKTQRHQTANRLRNFAAAFRMDSISPACARMIVAGNYRGRVARDERAVFSWLDGIKLPVDYIREHNAIIYENFADLFRETGLDIETILVQPLSQLPTIDSTIDSIHRYNEEALECAKNLLQYECIRVRPATNSMRVAPFDSG